MSIFGKNKKSIQEGGNNSTNLQGQNVVLNTGITYSDAKEIALDVFKTDFIELSQSAANIAKQRAEELVDNFLNKLEEKNPSKLDMMEDPDMQYAIFTAQKEYARSGEKEMEDMLVNILLERINENTQSLKKIVLNESLEVLPKLTNSQLDILTLVFLLHETRNNNVNSSASLKNYLDTFFKPFLNNLTKDKASYQHLQFTGCCTSIGIVEDRFSEIMKNQYKGIFSLGFEKVAFDSIVNGEPGYESLLVPCINNLSLFQLRGVSAKNIKQNLAAIGKDESKLPQLTSLLDKYVMSVDQANDHLIKHLPEMENLIDVYKNSYMCALVPTSVGIMLAYINLKRKAGIELDINIWIK